MLKNITFTVEDNVIRKARQKALGEKKSLNVLIRGWLTTYVDQKRSKVNLDEFLSKYSHIKRGDKKFTREEMNER